MVDSLYDDGTGKKIPTPSDINQCSYNHLNYLLKKQGIGDCYLLTDLMGLARRDPNFITSKLIKVKNDNEVDVYFYKLKEPQYKISKGLMKTIFESTGSKISYSVKKSEALEWKTDHYALWPVVVEIAYAKYMKDKKKLDTDNAVKQFKITARAFCENKLKDKKGSLSKEEYNKLIDEMLSREISAFLYYNNGVTDDSSLKSVIEGGLPTETLTSLTGVKSKQVTYGKVSRNELRDVIDDKIIESIPTTLGLDKTGIKKFSTKNYSESVLRIYNKIRKKLDSKKIITASFEKREQSWSDYIKGIPFKEKMDKSSLALAIVCFKNEIKNDPKKFFNSLNHTAKDKANKWLKDNNLELEDFGENLKNGKITDKQIANLCLEVGELEQRCKISKTKSDILAKHAYLVLDTVEHDGYKYIVLKNPHDMKTRFNYKKSSKLPKEVKLPKQIDSAQNECMMELNHFCKLILALDYDANVK